MEVIIALVAVVAACAWVVWAVRVIWRNTQGGRQQSTAAPRAAPRPHSPHSATIMNAIAHRQPLVLRYADAKGEITERVVDPYGWDGSMMEAHCRLRGGEVRHFRADRIIDLAPLP